MYSRPIMFLRKALWMARAWFLYLGLPAPSLAHAQRVVMLQSPVGEHRHAFSSISGVRELSDERVIVLDEPELSVHVVDIARQTIAIIGRNGAGPGEYGWPAQLFRFAGDTTAVRDGQHARLVMLVPGGTQGATSSLDGRPTADPISGLPSVTATDATGRLFGYALSPDGGVARILRWKRSGSEVDTIATLELKTGPAPAPGFTTPVGPYSAETSWAVAPDGRVAVIHPQPYSIDLFIPGATTIKGKPLPHREVRLTEAHKEEWRRVALMPKVGLAITGSAGNYVSAAQKVVRPFREPRTWPSALPPFLPGAGQFSESGDLWIRRTTDSVAKVLYDVVDSAGSLRGQVRLPVSTRIVGFGVRSVYVARVDADGLHYLQRYADPFRSGLRH